MYLRAFGEPRLTGPEISVILPAQPAVLLILLVESNFRVERSTPCSLLWPAASAQRARHSLSQLCYRLRNRYGFLEFGGDKRWLTLAESALDSDLAEFRRHEAASERRQALRLAQDDWMVARALDHECNEEAVEWLDELRGFYRARMRAMLAEELITAEAQGEWAILVEFAQKTLELDPFDEDGHYAKALALAVDGRHSDAIRALDEAKDLFVRELGVPLSGKLLRLALRLSKQKRGVPQYSAPVGLLGRSQEYSRLRGYVEECLRGARCAIAVTGEAGIGKTALVRHVAEPFALEGVRILSVRCGAAERMAAGAAISLLLETVEEPDLALLSDAEHGAIISFFPDLPRLRAARPERSIDMPPSEVIGRIVMQAIVTIFATQSKETPLLLIVDDAQWLDPFSAATIAVIAQKCRTSSVCVALTYRTAPTAPQDSGILGLLRDTIPDELDLVVGPLNDDGISQITTAISPSLLRHAPAIAAASGGNPFYAIEIAQAVHHQPPTQASSLFNQGSLVAVVHRRASNVSDDARLLWAGVVVADSPMPVHNLANALELPTNRAMSAVGELRGAHLITDDGPLIAPQHDIVRQIAYESIPVAQRSLLHIRFAEAYARQNRPGTALAAFHYNKAGLANEAAENALVAARHNYSLLAYEDALGLADLALAQGVDSVGIEATLIAARSRVALGRVTEAAIVIRQLNGKRTPELTRLLAFCELHEGLDTLTVPSDSIQGRARSLAVDAATRGDYFLASQVLPVLCDALHEAGKAPEIRIAIRSIVQLAAEWSDMSATSRLLRLATNVSLIYGTHQEAMEYANQSVETARMAGDRIAYYAASRARALVATRAGRSEDSIREWLSVRDDLSRRGLTYLEDQYVNNFAVILMEAGEPLAASATLRDALSTCSRHTAVYAAVNLCLAGIRSGVIDDVILGFEALRFRLVEGEPAWAKIYYATFFAWILAVRGDTADAINAALALRDVMSSGPTLDDPSYSAIVVAWGLRKSGQVQDAVEFLMEEGAKVQKRNVPAYRRLSHALERAGSEDESDRAPFGAIADDELAIQALKRLRR